MPRTSVSARSAGNLRAIAQRGARLTAAQPLLPVDAVDLVDDAVDVVGEARPLRLQLMEERRHLSQVAAEAGERIDRKAHALQPGEEVVVGGGDRLARLAPGVGEEAQGPRAGHRRIELAQRSRRGVARIGEDLAAGRPLPFVQIGEVGLAHVDLAAHLEDRRRAGDAARDIGEGREVAGDVLAGGAVAAGRAGDEAAALVAERHRQPVDLRLGHRLDGQSGIVAQLLQPAADTGHEFGELGVGEGVVERQHRPAVDDLGEAGGGGGADPHRRSVVADEIGEAGFDRTVAPLQRIVAGVVDDRRVLLVVGAVERR